MEICVCKESTLRNITATDELLKAGNDLQHHRLLSLPLPSIYDAA